MASSAIETGGAAPLAESLLRIECLLAHLVAPDTLPQITRCDRLSRAGWTPKQIGLFLGISANAASVLARRAKARGRKRGGDRG